MSTGNAKAKMVMVKAEPPEEHHGAGGGGSNSSSSAVDPSGCSSYVFLLPNNAPLPASVIITFAGDDGGSEKNRSHATVVGSIVKMGPCGGGGGHARDMDMAGMSRIIKIVIRHDGLVDAMSVIYERNGVVECTRQWGGDGGKRSEINLQPDEYLTSVRGHFGQFREWFVMRSLTFVRNLRSFGPFGKEEGVPFVFPAAAAGGGRILGFHARSGNFLDALGVYVVVVN